jgi:hypothetical protein
MRLLCFCVLGIIGCQTPEYRTCDAMCTELVQTCDYDAFPSMDSCMQGCASQSAAGSDIEGHEQCIMEASCDTFAIVECQNAFDTVE